MTIIAFSVTYLLAFVSHLSTTGTNVYKIVALAVEVLTPLQSAWSTMQRDVIAKRRLEGIQE